MALAHCILSKFLGVGCHSFPPPSPTFSASCLYVQRRERPLAAEGGTLRGRETFRQISSRIRLPRNSRNLRHGTDGFTSPPKEGVLRIFSPLKIRRLRPGLNPANLGTNGQHATSRPIYIVRLSTPSFQYKVPNYKKISRTLNRELMCPRIQMALEYV
jgi:hypothetical protein